MKNDIVNFSVLSIIWLFNGFFVFENIFYLVDKFLLFYGFLLIVWLKRRREKIGNRDIGSWEWMYVCKEGVYLFLFRGYSEVEVWKGYEFVLFGWIIGGRRLLVDVIKYFIYNCWLLYFFIRVMWYWFRDK